MNDFELDPFIDDVARALKEPVRFDARFDERVMAALQPPVIALDSRRSVTPWHRRRVSFSVSGLAAAAAVAGVIAYGALSLGGGNESTSVATAPGLELTPVANTSATDPNSAVQSIQFLLIAPNARTVSLVGQFNGWDPAATPMTYDEAHGAWHVQLPLIPGLYQYQFLLDGTQRVTDPAAPQVGSEFGSPNSLLTVRARE